MNLYLNNLDNETINKALFVIKSKGSSLSREVRKLVEENAKQFEDYIKK